MKCGVQIETEILILVLIDRRGLLLLYYVSLICEIEGRFSDLEVFELELQIQSKLQIYWLIIVVVFEPKMRGD